jgi:chromosome segregation ATPase
LPTVGGDGLLIDVPDTIDANGHSANAKVGRAPSRWITRREQVLSQLQEGYERVSVAIEDVRRHLVQQEQRSERVCTSLEQLARSTNELPQVARQQAQTLEAIASQLETTHVRTRQLTEAVAEIPKVARNQMETLGSLNRQLEVSSEQGVVTHRALEKLETAVFALGELNGTQAKALSVMNEQTREQNALLTKMIERQNRRLAIVLAAALLVGMTALAAMVVSLSAYPAWPF